MIRTDRDIADGLAALQRLDPGLARVVEIAGTVPLRKSPEGLRGLAGTIVAQQVSRASAEAIFRRLCETMPIDDAAAILAAADEDFRRAGLSRGKQQTLLGIAAAVVEGRLDFTRLGLAPPNEAVAELVALRGIGVWTAECYLLFAAGHPDIFPAGDLALQAAVAHARGLAARPGEKALVAIAAGWAPHRSVAARLFWSYYHAITRRDAAPGEPVAASGDSD